MTEPGPHRRFNPLRGEWVLVSPQRSGRPWQGQVETTVVVDPPAYDPACYLCPGNVRANGSRNPGYSTTFAFENDFGALVPLAGESLAGNQLLKAQPERGVCRVLCFTPRHDLSLPRMNRDDVRTVVDAWVGECAALAEVPWLRYALVFENRGPLMGASNPHPHCQIWATEHVPDEPAAERASLTAYAAEHDSCLLCDYVRLEIEKSERVVCVNDHFAAIVPFWAVWPFETLVVARRHVAAIAHLDDAGRDALADLLKALTTRYDNLFEAPFPYSMGFHQQLRAGADAHEHLHAHFYPPLLRGAVRKFMVGFELLGSPQRDITPEEAARRLQSVDAVHYSDRARAGTAR